MSKGIKDYEKKKTLLLCQQNFKCGSCGEAFLPSQKIDLSHRIPKTKANIKIYGLDVIDNIKNLVATHANGHNGLSCNDSVMISRASQPVKAEALYQEIKQDLEE